MKLRHHIRNLLADTLHATGVAHPRRIPLQRLTIVTLHRVLQPRQVAEYPLPGLAVTPSFFNELCEYFSHYFQCVTVTDGLHAMTQTDDRDKPLLAVTFDDGRMDNFEQAAPILDRYQIPATFYIPAGFVGTDDLLWHDAVAYSVNHLIRQGEVRQVEEILGASVPQKFEGVEAYWAANHVTPMRQTERELTLGHLATATGSFHLPDWEHSMGWLELNQLFEQGHEIGSHTMTHAVLGGDCCNDLQREIADSRELLQRHLGTLIKTFSYPTGACDESTCAMVQACGYKTAVTTNSGFNDKTTDPFRLNRFNLQQSQNVRPAGKLNPSVLACRLNNFIGAR